MPGWDTYLRILLPLVAVVMVLALLASLLPRAKPATPSFARRATPPTTAQLREDPNAKLSWDRGGLLFSKRYWFVGTGCPPTRIDPAMYRRLQEALEERPVRISQANGRTWWRLGAHFYWESGGYSEQDVLALVRARERQHKQRLDRAHMLLHADRVPAQRRQVIPRAMKRAVFERDGGKCQECGSTFDLQYDHVIPVALGGATSLENLQLLCSTCNLAKGADV